MSHGSKKNKKSVTYYLNGPLYLGPATPIWHHCLIGNHFSPDTIYNYELRDKFLKIIFFLNTNFNYSRLRKEVTPVEISIWNIDKNDKSEWWLVVDSFSLGQILVIAHFFARSQSYKTKIQSKKMNLFIDFLLMSILEIFFFLN